MEGVETMRVLNKKDLVKLVSYMVMGDGGVYISGGCKNAFFAMNMKSEHKDYINFCKGVLENITSCTITERVLSEDGYERKPQLRLQSKTHPFFTKIRDRVYTGKYKGIDPHALKLLDAESLAILYMCDGSLVQYTKDGGTYFNVTLNMKRLSYGDLFILKKSLKEKLDLEWNINRQNSYYYLRLRSKDLVKFMDMIDPYIFPSFRYKMINSRVVDPS